MDAHRPLFILPPFGIQGTYGRCQAAISMSCHYPYRCAQPLPRWRYCSFCGDDLDGLMLCGVHRKAADRRGTYRLLPELQVWSPPPKQHGWVR